MVRAVQPHVEHRKNSARHCQVPDCGKATREGKPYCTEHVDQHVYVADLVQKLAEIDAEIAAVAIKGARAVNITGEIVHEITQYLEENGPRTVERIRRERLHDQSTDVTFAYVRAMQKHKMVKLGKTARGSTVVKLVSATPTMPVPKPKPKRKPKVVVVVHAKEQTAQAAAPSASETSAAGMAVAC